MKREFEQLGSREFDLLVIGGGAFGACAAWDASLRGLKVALIEQNDFCSGSSANPLKMVHGGIRYIQHGDVIRLRESCRERTFFLNAAPHLVEPLPIMIPTYGHGTSGKQFLGAGMLLYDLLTIDRNRTLSDPDRTIPVSKFFNKAEVAAEFNGLPDSGLTGAALFYDGQMYNPTRLCLAFVQSAAAAGATVANYAEAISFERTGNAISAVTVRDNLSGMETRLQTRQVLNATGPWAMRLLDKLGVETNAPPVTFSRDACFVIKRQINAKYGIAIQGRTRDPDALLSRPARHLFLVPWRNYTLVGVWHKVWEEAPESVSVAEAELSDYIDEINWAYPELALQLSDVSMWNAGLVPFGENEEGAEDLSYGKRSHVVDHSSDDISNLVSLIGIRWTMARADAEKAIDIVMTKLGQAGTRCATSRARLHGGDIANIEEYVERESGEFQDQIQPAVMRSLIRNYGTKYRDVISLAQGCALSETVGSSSTIGAQVLHAVTHEMACTLSDVVFRRSDLATGEIPDSDTIQACADILSGTQGWTADETSQEIDAVLSRF